jgi:hypothetical protein
MDFWLFARSENSRIREISSHENVCDNIRIFAIKFSFSETLSRTTKCSFSSFSCSGCPVQVTYLADLSSPTCLSCPVPVVLSQMSYPRCPVLIRLFCPGCPVLAVLFQLPYPGHFVHCSPDTTVMSCQSCHSLSCPG